MWILVLPASLAVFAAASLARAGWREAFLRALVWFGLATAVLTEFLSAFGGLRRVPLAAAWLAATGIAAGLMRRPRIPPIPRLSALDAGLAFGIASIAALVGWTAAVSPPNTWDALAYHLPSVVHWMQAGSV